MVPGAKLTLAPTGLDRFGISRNVLRQAKNVELGPMNDRGQEGEREMAERRLRYRGGVTILRILLAGATR